VLGVGCEAGVEDAELIAAVDAALAEAGLSPLSVAAVGTLDRKCEEPALRRLCTARGWELRGHPAAVLAEVEVPTPSAVVAAAVGTPSVSEAAALLGSPGARLRQAKRVRGRVTVAVGVAD